MFNVDNRIAAHAILDTERIYRSDLAPYDALVDDEPGILVVGNGMTVTVLAAFHDWNDVPGLDMLWVHCAQTGLHTHIPPRDVGWEGALL